MAVLNPTVALARVTVQNIWLLSGLTFGVVRSRHLKNYVSVADVLSS